MNYFTIIPGGIVIAIDSFHGGVTRCSSKQVAVKVLESHGREKATVLYENGEIGEVRPDLGTDDSHYVYEGRYYNCRGIEYIQTSYGGIDRPVILSVRWFDEILNFNDRFITSKFVSTLLDLTYSDNIHAPYLAKFKDGRTEELTYNNDEFTNKFGQKYSLKSAVGEYYSMSGRFKKVNKYLINRPSESELYIKHGDNIVAFVAIYGVIAEFDIYVRDNQYLLFHHSIILGETTNVRISSRNFKKIKYFASKVCGRFVYRHKTSSHFDILKITQVSDTKFIIDGNPMQLEDLSLQSIEKNIHYFDYYGFEIDKEGYVHDFDIKAFILSPNVITFGVGNERAIRRYHDEYRVFKYHGDFKMHTYNFPTPSIHKGEWRVIYQAISISINGCCFIINDKFVVLDKFIQTVDKMYINSRVMYDITIETVTGEILYCCILSTSLLPGPEDSYYARCGYLQFEDGRVIPMFPKNGEYYCRYGKFNEINNKTRCLRHNGDVVVFVHNEWANTVWEFDRTYMIIYRGNIEFGIIVEHGKSKSKPAIHV